MEAERAALRAKLRILPSPKGRPASPNRSVSPWSRKGGRPTVQRLQSPRSALRRSASNAGGFGSAPQLPWRAERIGARGTAAQGLEQGLWQSKCHCRRLKAFKAMKRCREAPSTVLAGAVRARTQCRSRNVSWATYGRVTGRTDGDGFPNKRGLRRPDKSDFMAKKPVIRSSTPCRWL